MKRLANAFYPNAELGTHVGGVARLSVARYKRRHKGLWVGGEVVLGRDGITFTPNALNRAIHERVQVITIPASNIISIRRRFGWLSGIVEVRHDSGLFEFRCFGAKALVERYVDAFGPG